MRKLTDLKINFERWIFRMKQKRAKRKDIDLMARAIVKANLQSNKTKKRLWVLKFAPGDYQILTKCQIKAFFRNMRPMFKDINYFQTNEFVIHITKRPNE